LDNTHLIPGGASAEIEIVTDAKDNALAIPSRAVLGMGEQRYVFRYIKGRIRKTPVTRGIGNYERSEIVSGISQGDIVVLPGDAAIKDGLRANIEIQPWP
ncbi:MAG: hypothetical protein AABZ06_04995, partial [Bdellovibrionota bacterium]